MGFDYSGGTWDTIAINIRCFHRVPVTFRMQVPDVGSQGQAGVEEPAVTETTISPDDDPKMVNGEKKKM